jgi:predicted permease
MVVGVVDDGVRDPLYGAVDVWLPADLGAATGQTWDNNYLDAFGRLAPGTSVESARAELSIIASRHADLEPAAAEKAFQVIPLREDLVGSARPLLLALGGAVGFLLLLTCSNVATLLLARAATRERELAIRSTLGSTRRHLARYFLVESGLVAIGGGACGLVVGWFALEALLAIAPADLPLRETIGLWPSTSLFAAGLAAGVGLVLGVGTSLPYARPAIGAVLAEGGRSGQGGIGARSTRAVLVVVEVALAVVLLVGAGILFRTVDALRSTDLGVNTTEVVAFNANLAEASYPSAESRIRAYADVRARLEAIPGIEAAGATSHLPVTGSHNTWGTRRASAVGVPYPGDNIQANQRIAGGAYFSVVGVRLLAGRLLDERDGPDAPAAVVVNESLVDVLFGDDEPVGQLLRVGPLFPVIVGVIADVALGARTGSAPMVFHSFEQFGAGRSWPMTHVVRVASGRDVPWNAIRSALANVDPDLVLYDARSLDEVVVADIGNERFAALLLQAFAALALILASLGLYGVVAHSVERRRHEIGVRMALGAGRHTVSAMIMRHGLTLALTGVIAGIAGAFAVSRALRFLVFGVTATDPAVFLGVPLLLLLVAILASWLPARQATRVEPASSLGAT